MFINKSTSLTKQSSIFFTTIFLTKLLSVLIEIHSDLIMKLEKYWEKWDIQKHITNMKSQTNCEWLQMTGNSLVETKK